MELAERINIAISRIEKNEAPRRIPVDETDVDVVLVACKQRITELERETDELVAKCDALEQEIHAAHAVGRAEGRERLAKMCDAAAAEHQKLNEHEAAEAVATLATEFRALGDE